MSVAEIAEKLGIKPDTVYVWITSKALPGHRLGRVWRFDPEEVDTWVRSGAGAAPKRSEKVTTRKKTSKQQRGQQTK
jgi:excisionase family DNA binding protein